MEEEQFSKQENAARLKQVLHRGFWRYKPEHYKQNKKEKEVPKISAAEAFNDAIDAALHISSEGAA